jgi:hypothetical protein
VRHVQQTVSLGDLPPSVLRTIDALQSRLEGSKFVTSMVERADTTWTDKVSVHFQPSLYVTVSTTTGEVLGTHMDFDSALVGEWDPLRDETIDGTAAANTAALWVDQRIGQFQRTVAMPRPGTDDDTLWMVMAKQRHKDWDHPSGDPEAWWPVTAFLVRDTSHAAAMGQAERFLREQSNRDDGHLEIQLIVEPWRDYPTADEVFQYLADRAHGGDAVAAAMLGVYDASCDFGPVWLPEDVTGAYNRGRSISTSAGVTTCPVCGDQDATGDDGLCDGCREAPFVLDAIMASQPGHIANAREWLEGGDVSEQASIGTARIVEWAIATAERIHSHYGTNEVDATSGRLAEARREADPADDLPDPSE